MAASINSAMRGMCIEEDEDPFDMPDLPEYCSSDQNRYSILGKVLNPEEQKMTDLLRDMPRKWQMYERVRGVALSKDSFQFIFSNNFEMEAVLAKGVHTYNQWSQVMDRWVERPPQDYLKFITVWVQIRNIPVNHYTVATITQLGEFAGQVVEVAFDPMKPRLTDYVRVQIKFDVSKPVRRSKIINFKHIGPVKITYDFERIQKRCFACQRLTHSQEKCPFLAAKSMEKDFGPGEESVERLIRESDPLFGVIDDNQVGVNPNTGRPRMAKEVIDHMRQYLMVEDGTDKLVKEDRIKASLGSLKNNLLGEKVALSLEPIPLLTKNLNKGKGIVFNYEEAETRFTGEKLMGEAIKAGFNQVQEPKETSNMSDSFNNSLSQPILPSQRNPTAYAISFNEAGSSGNTMKNGKPRKRPYKSRRRKKTHSEDNIEVDKQTLKEYTTQSIAQKRKAAYEASKSSKDVKRKKAVPMEGLPRI